MARDLDPGSSPAAFLGAELRRARVVASMSQEQFSRSLGFDRTVITKAETGERPPSPEMAAAIDEALPHLDGLFSRLTLLARRANGRYPEWFREWVDAEQQATALRTWQPILVPGLCRPGTMRGPCSRPGSRRRAAMTWMPWSAPGSNGRPSWTEPIRLSCWRCWTRRSCTGRSARPRSCATSWPISARCPAVRRLRSRSSRPRSARTRLLGGFFVGSFDDTPVIVYAETAVEGITIDKPALVSKAAQAFERLRSEALLRGASRDLIRRVAEQRWTT